MAVRAGAGVGRRGGGGADSAPGGRQGQAALGWAALGLALASALPLGSARPVSWLALSALTAALFAAQLALDFRRPPDAARLRALAAPGLLYAAALAWGLVQGVPGAGAWAHPAWGALAQAQAQAVGLGSISADPLAGPPLAARMAAYAGLFWIAARAARDPLRARRMTEAAALAAAALAAFGLGAALLGNPILDLEGRAGAVVSASFVNRNSFATWAAFGALANLAAFAGRMGGDGGGGARLREGLEAFFAGGWVFALGFALTATALAASQSRAGAGAGLVGLAVFLLAHGRRGGQGGAAMAAAAALGAFALAAAGSGLVGRLLAADAEEARFAVYPLVWAGFLDRPWLGHGLGAFEDVFRGLVTPALATGEWTLAHNSYLENLFEFGAPAAAALYLALGLVIWRLARGAAERRRARAYPCLGLAVAAVAAFHSLFDFSLQIPAVAAFCAVLLGIGWAQSFREPAALSPSR